MMRVYEILMHIKTGEALVIAAPVKDSILLFLISLICNWYLENYS